MTVHPHIRRVHVRRDSEGRWFWYHHQCRGAEAEFPTQPAALTAGVTHSCEEKRSTMLVHIAVNPDGNSQSASWLCPYCKQYCASHNPCDCCMDDEP
jgi:hypothetical protein